MDSKHSKHAQTSLTNEPETCQNHARIMFSLVKVREASENFECYVTTHQDIFIGAEISEKQTHMIDRQALMSMQTLYQLIFYLNR